MFSRRRAGRRAEKGRRVGRPTRISWRRDTTLKGKGRAEERAMEMMEGMENGRSAGGSGLMGRSLSWVIL